MLYWLKWTLWWNIITLPCRVGRHRWTHEHLLVFDWRTMSQEYDEWFECSLCHIRWDEKVPFGRLID